MVCFIHNAYLYIVKNVLLLPLPPTLPQLLLLVIIGTKEVKPLDNAPLEPLLHRLPGPALHHAPLLHHLPKCDSNSVLALYFASTKIKS